MTMIAAAVIEVITRRCGENWITPIMKKWRSGRRTVPIVTVLAEEGTLDLTLKVVSVAPRVFVVDNFLSRVGVDWS